jgi:hypothetical protein
MIDIRSMTVQFADEDSDDSYEPQFGVSYIGGDPCGSKYNTDPHNESRVERPGMPDSMKARIQALVDQRKQQKESEEKEADKEKEEMECGSTNE